ncbi:MAG: bifunctional folylpolyglutamate synthase/dihydrofolate synthase [Anaerolineae bacterium]|nr:bifunctional folylpolyglutamate synthase/dihydrofolate synthase [Anaerolineae bacterium]
MEYHDALRYLYSLIDYEKRPIDRIVAREFKLERVHDLLHQIGDPHQTYPTLHIAGTKGKGSVSAMLAAIVQAGGLRAGLFTSPHLHTYRDRIQINGEAISRSDMAVLIEELKPVVDSAPELSMFEVTTALAFLYFARQKVDLAVMEVGLGGRLDATNVILPEISVITSLSLDHTAVLGDTLAQIAGEKAGIIKPGVPVISAPQQPEALAVLRRVADERRAPLTAVGQDWTWESGRHTLEGQTLTVHKASSASAFDGEYTAALLGDFQQENAAVVVAAAATLAETGHDWVTPQGVRNGLRRVVWPGRMEILSREPSVVVDCAHNPYSAQVLMHSLRGWFPDTRWVLIYGASADKDIDGILRALLPNCEHVIVARSHHPRAAAPEMLVSQCAALGHVAEPCTDAQQALDRAWEQLTPGLGIIVTGSIFIVADFREAWAKRYHLELPLGDWVDEPW